MYINPNLTIHPTHLFPHDIHISVPYVCISIPALPMGHLYHFSRVHIHVELRFGICFPFSDLLYFVWQTLKSHHISTKDPIPFLFMDE